MDYQAFYDQLKKGQIQRLYLMEGEEEYGKESALAALKKALLKGPMAMLNESPLTNPEDSQLIAVCETLPIMEDRRLVVVREAAALLGKGQAKAEEDEEPEPKARASKNDLAAYLDRLPETVCLVFFVRGKARATSRLYKKIKALNGVVSFDQLDQERLIKWVAREFAAFDLNISRQSIEHLVFACGKELMQLKGEIAKIAAFAQGKDSISLADIDAVATLNVEYKVFDLSDKVAEGRADLALPLMQDMLRGGEQRLMLLALLQRHYRQLLFARILMDSRASQASIMAELGLPPFVVRKLMQSAQGYTRQRLQAAYQQCIKQEYLVKSGQLAEEGSLEQLVLWLIHQKHQGGQRRA